MDWCCRQPNERGLIIAEILWPTAAWQARITVKTMLFKLNSRDLKVGMFVSELDRPWIDTPFLIQGFLIRDPREIASLRAHCNYAYVDPNRSAAGLLPNIPSDKSRQVAPPGQGSASASRGEVIDLTGETANDGSVSDTGRFMSMAQQTSSDSESVRTSLRAKLRRAFLGRAQAEKLAPPPPRYAFIPPDVSLVRHTDTHSLEEERVSASRAFDDAKYAMNRMVADTLGQKRLVLDYVWKAVNDVVESMLRNDDAMMWVAMTTQQDATIYGRGVRAAVHLVALGKHLGFPRIRLSQIAMVGALLDIGKTALPLRLLTKPEQLSEEEFELVKGHVRCGLELLENAAPLHADIMRAIAEHHEREDGSGYPNALKGEEIGLFGRMSAIVDTFMALTDERPFAEAMSPYTAFRRLTEWSRTLFHAPLTQQYIQAIGVFPVGSLVELSSGEIAVVVGQNREQRLKPRVLIVADKNKAAMTKQVHADLAQEKLVRGKPAPLSISGGLPAGSYGLDERHLRPA